MLKIAFTGTHGAGKTTLTKAVSEALNLDPIIVSRPTAVAKDMGYDKAGDIPKDSFYTFQMLSLFEQIHQERLRPEGFVADRSVLDFLAYYRNGCYPYKQITEYSKTYEDIVFKQAQKYDFLFYLPPNPNGVEDDGRRFVTQAETIDAAIQEIIEETSIVTIPVPWLPEDKRLEYVLRAIKG